MPKYRQSSIHTTPFFRRTTKMPSTRRIKVFGVLIFIAVISILFWSSSMRQRRDLDSQTDGDFYSKTVKGLDKKPVKPSVGEDEEVAKQMAQRLKEAAQLAKDNANAKAPKPDPPSSLVGVGNSAEGKNGVAGRKKFDSGNEQKVVKEETKEEHDIETELNSILKKSPIIIFSKSYCPHSRRAKNIFAKYTIDPEPFVVELDQHPLGPGLQARLAELTGRRTVPNILINAVSIGGGDDTAALDDSGTLIAKVKELGGTKILDIKEKPAGEDGHDLR